MNWPQVNAILTGILAVGALLNYFVLLNIKSSISQLSAEIREWVHDRFAEKDWVERIEVRLNRIEHGA
jgi:hypothetical protein